MGSRIGLIIFLLLSTAALGNSSPVQHDFVRPVPPSELVGECIGPDNEMAMDSETNRRQLSGTQKYISYSALKKDSVPCNRKGQSYYNCTKMKQANPYKRGCSTITHCQRQTNWRNKGEEISLSLFLLIGEYVVFPFYFTGWIFFFPGSCW